MQHVVDERELSVDEERRGKRVVGDVAQTIGHGEASGYLRRVPAVAMEEGPKEARLDSAAHAEEPLDRIGRRKGARDATRAGGSACGERNACTLQTRRQPTPVGAGSGGPVLRVTAQ